MDHATYLMRSCLLGALVGTVVASVASNKVEQKTLAYPNHKMLSADHTLVPLLAVFMQHWKGSDIVAPVLAQITAALEAFLQLLAITGHNVQFKAHRCQGTVEQLLKNVCAHSKGLGTQNKHHTIEEDIEAIMKYLNDLMHNRILEMSA